MSEEKVQVKKFDSISYEVSKIYRGGTFVRVLYTRAELEQLVVEAKKILEEER